VRLREEASSRKNMDHAALFCVCKSQESEDHFLRLDFSSIFQLNLESSVAQRDYINRFLPDTREKAFASLGLSEQIREICRKK
jgi:hypothetical protein